MAFRSFTKVFEQGFTQKYVRVRAGRSWPGEPPDFTVRFDMGGYAQGQEHTQYVLLTAALARRLSIALGRAADEMDRRKQRRRR